MPDAPALEHGDASICYRDLSSRADILAAVLADRGVGRGDLVALRLADPIELITAAIAVLDLLAHPTVLAQAALLDGADRGPAPCEPAPPPRRHHRRSR